MSLDEDRQEAPRRDPKKRIISKHPNNRPKKALDDLLTLNSTKKQFSFEIPRIPERFDSESYMSIANATTVNI